MTDASELDGHILVIGASGMDLVGRAGSTLEMGTSNPGTLRISPGGVARNIAENLARLGADTVLVTVLGEDQQGELIRDTAGGAGVRIDPVIAPAGTETGAYLAVLDQKGRFQLGLDDMGLIGHLTARAIQDRAHHFEGALAVIVDANLPVKSLASVIRLARRSGVPVAADPTSRALAERLRPHFPELWIVSPNEAEAELLSGLSITDDPSATEAARKLVSDGVATALITRAEFGVSYATSDVSGQIPAVQTEIVDPTGAGDALLATTVFGLLSGIPIDESVRLAVTAASLALRTAGSVVPDLSLEMLYDQLL